MSAGTQLDLGDHSLRVVWPVAESFVEPGNDSSVVVSLEPVTTCEGCVSALFLGDLGEQPQQILLGRERFTARDVVKVSHHGSRDQFEGLYQVLAAEIGLIGVGSENTYGHPTQGALDILERSGTRAMRSDERGIMTLSRAPDGTLKIWSER